MMEQLAERQSLWAALLSCFVLGGCGSGDGLVPVEGAVTLDGKPLAEATVVLSPTKATDPGPFSGTTNAEGKFSLSPSDRADESGAMPGEYQIFISTLKVEPSEVADDTAVPKVLAPELVPEEYRQGNMRFEVPAGGTTAAIFELGSR